MNIKIQKLHPDAVVPTYATSGAACFDLYATESKLVVNRCVIDTGLAFEIPEGYVMLVHSRSGHGFKFGVRLANGTGIIDSDYRGELMVALHNDGDLPLRITAGDRIAQAMIVPVPQVSFTLVEELSTTDRGSGGFGSTGA